MDKTIKIISYLFLIGGIGVFLIVGWRVYGHFSQIPEWIITTESFPSLIAFFASGIIAIIAGLGLKRRSALGFWLGVIELSILIPLLANQSIPWSHFENANYVLSELILQLVINLTFPAMIIFSIILAILIKKRKDFRNVTLNF